MDIQSILLLLVVVIIAVVAGNIISSVIQKKDSLGKTDLTEEKIGRASCRERV